MTKPTKMACALSEDSDQPGHPKWIAKEPRFLHSDSEDSDQTGRMPRLIAVFAGRTGHFVGFVVMRLIGAFYTELSNLENFHSGYSASYSKADRYT